MAYASLKQIGTSTTVTKKAPPHQQVASRERGQHDDGADGTPSEIQPDTSFFLSGIDLGT